MTLFLEGFGGFPTTEIHADVVTELGRRGINVVGTNLNSIREYDRGKYFRIRASNSTYGVAWSVINLLNMNCTFIAFRCRGHAEFGYIPICLFPLANHANVIKILNTNVLQIVTYYGMTAASINLPGAFTDWKDFQFVLTGGVFKIFLNADDTPIYTSGFTSSYFSDLIIGSSGQPANGIQGIEITNIIAHQLTDVVVEGIEVKHLGTSVVSNTGTVSGTATDASDAFATYSNTEKYIRYETGDKTTFSLSGIVDHPVSVSSLGVTTLGRITGSASTDQVITITTESENVVNVPRLAIGFAGHRTCIDDNPHDTSPLTKEVVNSMQIGVGG